jgi:DUF971 family protein
VSFWDHIKPTQKVPVPTAIDLSPDQKVVSLTWDDGRTVPVTAQLLRQNCPCAECVDEWTRQRTFAPDKISPDTRVLEVVPMGNYAVTFQFSDAHRTGIFNWTLLRSLSEPSTPPT